MEEYTTEEGEKEEAKYGDFKRWFQDNLRIIISIAIVVIIAGGIYSYSKRTDAPTVSDEAASTENTEADSATNSATTNEATNNTEEKKVSNGEKSAVATAPGQETETGYIETAMAGEGSTKLARKALADYLEKNPDSVLTKEHKIYIEDFLRKQQPRKSVHVGTTMEFSKDSIQKAISTSKTLTAHQLKNLEKYSARVSNL